MNGEFLSGHFLKIIIPVHLLAVLAGVLFFSGSIEWQWLWLTYVGWVLISGFGVAIGFHRLISHGAFHSRHFTRNVLAYLGSMGAQGSPVFWASLHNGLHHPFSDTARDLHSPINGKFNSYIGWQIFLKPSSAFSVFFSVTRLLVFLLGFGLYTLDHKYQILIII